MKRLIQLTVTIWACLATYCLAGDKPASPLSKMSVETLAAIRHVNIGDRVDYGAGVDVGFKFNNWVSGHVRLVALENNNWGDSAIDEASLLCEAVLMKSANGGLTLSAIGGADRDFNADDWGFSVGLRPSLALTKRLSLVAESRIRAWFDQEKDIITTAGLKFTF